MEFLAGERSSRGAPVGNGAHGGDEGCLPDPVVTRRFLGLSDDLFVIVGLDGVVRYVNGASREVLGFAPDEIVGRPYTSFLDATEVPATEVAVRRTVACGELRGFENRHVHRDGSVRWVHWSNQVDAEMGVLYCVGRDVTERRRAEERLREREATFERLFRANPLPMWVYDEATLRFLAVNDAALAVYGYGESEFLAMTIADIRPEGGRTALWALLSSDRRVLREARGVQHVRKDGRVLDVEVSSHALDFEGCAARLVAVHDVTERLATERAVRASEERHRLLADNAIDVVYRFRLLPEPALEYVSPSVATLTGYTTEEHYAHPELGYAVVHPEDLPGVAEAARSGGPFRRTIRCVRKDGAVVFAEIHNRGRFTPDGRLEAIEGIARDVTERQRAAAQIGSLNARLQEQVRHREIVHRFDQAILMDAPTFGLAEPLLDEVLETLGLVGAALFRLDPATEVLEPVVLRGDMGGTRALRLDEGISGQAAAERRPVLVPDVTLEREADVRHLARLGFRGAASFPLVSMGRLEGALTFVTRARLELDDEAASFLEVVAQQVAVAFQRERLLADLRRANEDLKGAYDATIVGWARALDLKDEETAGHSQRVTDLTLRLAERLGVPPDEREAMRWGALLHDIGKMGVPDAILLKPGRLTPEEFEVIKKHPAYAHAMLADIPFLAPALPIPRWHHERWDGAGYPDGLAGEAIPLAARIFAVVDVFDALTSDRPYRTAWTHEAALAHLREGAGSHFDPAVVDAFVALQEG